MKEVLVTIKVIIDQENYEFYKGEKYSDKDILGMVVAGFNSAKVDNDLTYDFEVDDIKEVKE
jgi:hypothetical protein